MSVSPLTIKLMFACYCSPDPATWFGDAWGSPAAITARNWLVLEGLVAENHVATDRGTAWVEFICATPIPIQRWVLPERENTNDNRTA